MCTRSHSNTPWWGYCVTSYILLVWCHVLLVQHYMSNSYVLLMWHHIFCSCDTVCPVHAILKAIMHWLWTASVWMILVSLQWSTNGLTRQIECRHLHAWQLPLHEAGSELMTNTYHSESITTLKQITWDVNVNYSCEVDWHVLWGKTSKRW